VTIASAEVKLEEWQQSQEGDSSPLAEHGKKFEEFCHIVDGKVGIIAGMDGAWQKRASGHSYSSRTGHNFCIVVTLERSWGEYGSPRIVDFVRQQQRRTWTQ
jgi:hypothetical protein